MSYVHDNAMLTRAHVRDAMQAYSAGTDSAVRAAGDGRPRRRRRAREADAAAADARRHVEAVVGAQPVVPAVGRVRGVRRADQAPPHGACGAAGAAAGVYAVTLRRPVIEAVTPPSVTVDDQLVLTGRNLRAPTRACASRPATRTRRRREIADERDRRQGAARRAARGAERRLRRPRRAHGPAAGAGQQPPLHRGFESNAGLFSLIPKITTEAHRRPAATPIEVVRGTRLRRSQSRRPSAARSASRSCSAVARWRRSSWPAPPAPAPDPTSTLRFRIPADHPTGLQLIQVRVDGAESALELETDASDPQFNQFVGAEGERHVTAWAEANQHALVGRARPRARRARAAAGAGRGVRAGDAAIDALAAIFGLSAFERDVLLLCAGVELDSALADLCATRTATRPPLRDVRARARRARRRALERARAGRAAAPLAARRARRPELGHGERAADRRADPAPPRRRRLPRRAARRARRAAAPWRRWRRRRPPRPRAWRTQLDAGGPAGARGAVRRRPGRPARGRRRRRAAARPRAPRRARRRAAGGARAARRGCARARRR